MVGLDQKAEIASILPEPTRSILGGIGDGRPRVSFGIVLGQRTAEDPTPVQQKFLDISHPKVRYNLAQRVRYFDPATGGQKVAPGAEIITFADDRGVIAINPFSEQTSAIMRPEEFERLTANSGGVFPLDMATTRHTFRENNPIITPMVKEAFHYAIELVDHGLEVAGLARFDDGEHSHLVAEILKSRDKKFFLSSWSQSQKYPHLKFL